MREKKILFLGKAGDEGTQKALGFLKKHFTDVEEYLESEWGKPFPAAARRWEGDLLVSYLSRWIVPPDVLNAAKDGAINFHPAPPEYPGTGCVNFAIYHGANLYGVTCHFMAAQVDAGPVIECRRFPLLHPDDDVESVLQATYEHLALLFRDQMFAYKQGVRFQPSPHLTDAWIPENRRTRKDLDRLMELSPEMTVEEAERVYRATAYGKWQPTITLYGCVYKGREAVEQLRQYRQRHGLDRQQQAERPVLAMA